MLAGQRAAITAGQRWVRQRSSGCRVGQPEPPPRPPARSRCSRLDDLRFFSQAGGRKFSKKNAVAMRRNLGEQRRIPCRHANLFACSPSEEYPVKLSYLPGRPDTPIRRWIATAALVSLPLAGLG